jgi:hypothetical protein
LDRFFREASFSEDAWRSTTAPRCGAALTWCGTLFAKSKSEKCAAPPSPAAGEELQKRKNKSILGIAEDGF